MDSVTAARKNIYKLIASVNENCVPIAITTSKGKGKSAALIGEDEWSAIEETLCLNSIPGMADIYKTACRRFAHPADTSKLDNKSPINSPSAAVGARNSRAVVLLRN